MDKKFDPEPHYIFIHFRIFPNGGVEFLPPESSTSTSLEVRAFMHEDIPKIKAYIESLWEKRFPKTYFV
jgi:hypothetical protein